jgi:hypothetical protein
VVDDIFYHLNTIILYHILNKKSNF